MKTKHLLFPVMLMLAAVLAGSCEKNDDNAGSPVLEQPVDVGGYDLNTRIAGENEPAVILMTGIGGSTADWSSMEDDIADVALVVNYDREGIGKSAWQNREKDSRTIALELHALINALGIEQPYVLAAHSLGGLHARMYASMYPDEVAGMLLVDPTPEYLIDSILALLPPDQRELALEQQRAQEEELIRQLPEGGLKEEIKAIPVCYDQVYALAFTTDMPVAVISSMKLESPDAQLSKSMAKKLRDDMLIRLGTTKSKHFTTEQAGHFIQKEQPELVMQALRWVLDNR